MRLTHFGDYAFPMWDAEDPLDTAATERAYYELYEGAYDPVGNDPAPGALRRLVKRFVVSADTPEALEDALDGLRALNGKRRRLWATRADGGLRWAWAACEGIRYTRGVRSAYDQEVEVIFALPAPGWNGVYRGHWTLNAGHMLNTGLVLNPSDLVAVGASPAALTVANSGNRRVANARVRIQNPAGAAGNITQIEIRLGDYHLVFGPLAPGKEAVLDCGARSATVDGVDAFESLALGDEHQAGEWLVLEPGDNTVTVTWAGTLGAGVSPIVGFSRYDGWE